ncbi:peptidyl-prolyl cis-trans isomerase D [Myroides gitamensis]|uniref:peptidylprolyl isomerase n=1 Tax=Myroides odoratus TaxID=256 RepID=UPI00216944E0|nr:peptidylprolyl isomerase [Myroides odoratus]MCS4237584.1 peptidyl-prolyl cis-trans isomerase D [Myroides odoratus]MDH6601677.1 peptidyl-prolyl cis-trans isomerase D [Myroides gitamensis]
MAVLSKIRQKSALLIAVIGIALLAFVIGDVVRSGGAGSSRNIGSVNGEDINTQIFQQKVSQAEQGNQMSRNQAYQMVWNTEVNNILLKTEFEKLGLQIGKDQLINVVKTNPMFANSPEFQNQLGQFDMAKFNAWVMAMKQAGPEQWQAWLSYEVELEKFGLQQMYNALVKGGVYTTQTEAKYAYHGENSKVTFDYVTVPYSTINDDQAKVSDSEITGYMQKHENRFKSEPTRELTYAYVESTPSEKDKEDVKETVEAFLKPTVQYNAETKKNDTIAGFKATKDLVAFINANSDVKFDSVYYAKKDLPLEFQEQLYNLPTGEVFGPYLFNDHYCISRMVGKKAGAKANAAHILISYAGAPQSAATRTKEEAKAKADEILKKATAANFAELAQAESEDPGSKANGGKYEDIAKGQMVKPFEDFIFNNATGKIGVVETDYGFHVIQVLGKSEGVQIATLARKVEASEATADEVFAKATNIESAATSGNLVAEAEKVNAVVQQNVTVRPFDEYLQAVGARSEIVSWAFNKETKDGDVKRFDIPDGYIIATLASTNNTGLLPIEEARKIVEPILMNEKKAQVIKQKMTAATVEEVSKQTNASIATVSEVSRQNPLIPNIGNEPLVVGTAFGTALNQNSKLIDGANGVYMVKTTNVALAPDLDNYNNYKTRTENAVRMSASSKVLQALKEQAKIKDNRIGMIQ